MYFCPWIHSDSSKPFVQRNKLQSRKEVKKLKDDLDADKMVVEEYYGDLLPTEVEVEDVYGNDEGRINTFQSMDAAARFFGPAGFSP